MADTKFSAFPATTSTTTGDTVVGLHSGANEQFHLSPTPAASAITLWDAHSNLSANNLLEGYATTATAAMTTTLTVSSSYQQFFTGTTTQTVVLPVTSTLVLGQSFYIVNNSTGVVTVESSGTNTIQAMAANSTLLVTCILTSGTTAASWNAQYIVNADVSGAVLLAPSGNQTITGNYTLQAYNMTATNALVGGNIELTGNTVESTNSNGNINIVPNGTGVINLTTSQAFLNASGLKVQGYSIGTPELSLGFASYVNNSIKQVDLRLYKSRSASVGSFTTVVTGDTLGSLSIYGDNGTSFSFSSSIEFLADGTVSSTQVPGKMVFFTTSSATGTLTAVLTLDSAQQATFANQVLCPNGYITSGSAAGGFAGNIKLYSPTAAMGTFQFLCADSSGNYTGEITNASLSASRTWTLPDATGTIALTGQVYTPVAASSSTQACVANTFYYVTYASTCALTLPASPALGSIVGVIGQGAGGWTLAPNTSQSIKLIGVSASTSVASAEAYDCIFVMYVATNIWNAYSFSSTGLTYS